MHNRGDVIQGFFPQGVMRVLPAQSVRATPNVRAVQLAQTPQHGAGQPLPPEVRQQMEAAFGASFADVRVHVGPHASSIGAVAYTRGADIHFAPNQYDPVSARGQQMLAHELAHVVQQRSGRVRNPFGGGVAVIQDATLEAEAERLALTVQRRASLDAQRITVVQGKGFSVPALSDLDMLSRNAKKRGVAAFPGNVYQFQAMKVGTAVVLTENDSASTDNFVADSLTWNKTTYANLVPAPIRRLTGADRASSWKGGVSAQATGGKIGTGGLIVMRGGQEGLHAEQGLLLALAYYLQSIEDAVDNGAPKSVGEVLVAGNCAPCSTCRRALTAFRLAMNASTFGTLAHSAEIGQDRDVTLLHLNEHFQNLPAGRFADLVTAYENAL